jgi:hypothetical protein
LVAVRPASAPDVFDATLRLLAYCQQRNWAGHDPYDALNSRLFAAFPITDFRLFRLFLTQLLKRSPVNFRPFLGIPPTQNPKALALFLSSILKLSRCGLKEGAGLADVLVAQLQALRSPGTDYWCWGYSFPWQTRTIVVPRGAPNLVCTTFVAGALLDACEHLVDPQLLAMAASAGEYLLAELYYTEGDEVASFSYPLPGMKTKVHNANFLAAALLSRLFQHTGNARFREPALKAARYSAAKQKTDGSWHYGEQPTQRWVDNFHTGYNLCALRTIGRCLDTVEFEPGLRRGFEFYRKHFLLPEGAVRYFHDRVYPIDIHCVAQSIITLLDFRDLDATGQSTAQSVYAWAMRRMWNEAGCFHYRVLPLGTIRTSYMRWSQAWMLLALASLVEADRANGAGPAAGNAPFLAGP